VQAFFCIKVRILRSLLNTLVQFWYWYKRILYSKKTDKKVKNIFENESVWYNIGIEYKQIANVKLLVL